ncbi:hypothetical protein [Magnetofaba australis]|uniref:Uncharacterized protein n=1 Tax=Magnetofaba australis IT-1 TaxID=1434232 RepID=A0A1Y2K7V9_9PROT|nr:hypothetical protein [Magnetofaba australis]OSM06143.1 hypothetical protein MAIT1_01104 [Magnetofaba australis IT-1]
MAHSVEQKSVALWRRGVAWVLDRAADALQQEITPDQRQELFARCIALCHSVGVETLDTDERHALMVAWTWGHQAGWVDASCSISIAPSDSASQTSVLQSWMKALPNDAIVTPKTGAAPELARFLPLWVNHADARLAAQMERLLRHIEIRRQDCLADGAGRSMPWPQRARIAAALAEYARRQLDWRFVNGALKLTDWDFPRSLPRRYRPGLAAMAWAIAAQEQAVQHLWEQAQ